MKETGLFRLDFAMSACESSLCSTTIDEGKTSQLFRPLIDIHDRCVWDILPSLVCTWHVLTGWTHNYMWLTLFFLAWRQDLLTVWLLVNICPSVNSLNSPLTCQHCCLGTFADTSAQSTRTFIGKSSLINMQKQITHFTSLSVSAALNQRWPKGVTMPSRVSPTG